MWLCTVRESVNPEYLFGKYLWVTGTSRTATEYSQRFAQRALQKIKTQQPFVVEVASNDGTFLQEFKASKILKFLVLILRKILQSWQILMAYQHKLTFSPKRLQRMF